MERDGVGYRLEFPRRDVEEWGLTLGLKNE